MIIKLSIFMRNYDGKEVRKDEVSRLVGKFKKTSKTQGGQAAK